MIEAWLLRNVEALYGLNSTQIQDHVESVVYDHRDHGIRVTMAPHPDTGGESDPAKPPVPIEVGKH